MKANRKLLLAAVIVGLVTVVALNSYIRSLNTPALASIPHSNVVVASSTIPAHTRITAEMLDVVSIPNDAVHPEALRSVDDAAGGISRTEIVRGEQVIDARVVTEDRRATLSYRVPEGMRAISIPVGEVTGVAGYISAGDNIDVLITYDDTEIHEGAITYTVFQNVNVLATGPNTREKDDEEQEVVGTVTLSVTAAQAEVLAYALLKGNYHLTLRSPLDEDEVELESYSSENFETFRGR
ncbi:Flp pilus assembly protein CpaB [Dethiobacter alkaliphilus]|uniref:Flp pilus assembly protein CpaB n=1 Tax=Dethiobacter alkaliphilus AHT 1 TaxID=555088 RepID=C0GEA3_DETAL|nr:Flp pilus assembly protein CpaB [Dethiobacter alkaliphilus]EEG78397.1 Flp pilus assembly protein CpaB [Dethiobacter alkaliphilus AHT 1]